MAWFSERQAELLRCPYQTLISRILDEDVIPEEVENIITRIPSFDPCLIPLLPRSLFASSDSLSAINDEYCIYPSVLHAAILKRNTAVAKFLIQKFTYLLSLPVSLPEPQGTPMHILMQCTCSDIFNDFLFNKGLELTNWCISSFPDYVNVMTKEYPQTPFHTLITNIFETKWKYRQQTTIKITQLCKIMIKNGAVIVPPVLPLNLIPSRKVWPLWSSTTKELLTFFFPKSLSIIIIKYCQDFWSFLMPFKEETGKDWLVPIHGKRSEFKKTQNIFEKNRAKNCQEEVESFVYIIFFYSFFVPFSFFLHFFWFLWGVEK